MEKRLISPEEAGRIVGCSPRLVRNLVKSGELPGFPLGGRIKIDLFRLEELLNGVPKGNRESKQM